MSSFGRTLIVIGAVIMAVGLLVTFGGRLPFRIGRLPGDILIKSKHSVFYFPLATSLLVSLLASLVLWLVSRR